MKKISAKNASKKYDVSTATLYRAADDRKLSVDQKKIMWFDENELLEKYGLRNAPPQDYVPLFEETFDPVVCECEIPKKYVCFCCGAELGWTEHTCNNWNKRHAHKA
jgi:hypothetical protein